MSHPLVPQWEQLRVPISESAEPDDAGVEHNATVEEVENYGSGD